jgi:predicted deacylase
MMRSDYVIDIHSGDANESLRPSFSAYYAEAGSNEVVRESRRIAVAFGLETIVQFAGSYDSVDEAIYTSAQAVTLGIPAMDVESGELGGVDDPYVDPITDGALNVMRELKMIAGEPDLPPNPLFISDRARVYSAHDGIWYANALVQAGDYVSEGTHLGRITDYHGNELETITAPASGILLILFGTPPVNEGDNIVVIGRVPADTPN